MSKPKLILTGFMLPLVLLFASPRVDLPKANSHLSISFSLARLFCAAVAPAFVG
jgi:hypothetical protein